MKSPEKLNLLVEKSIKRTAFAMAMKQRISVGRLFENLVAAADRAESIITCQNPH